MQKPNITWVKTQPPATRRSIAVRNQAISLDLELIEALDKQKSTRRESFQRCRGLKEGPFLTRTASTRSHFARQRVCVVCRFLRCTGGLYASYYTLTRLEVWLMDCRNMSEISKLRSQIGNTWSIYPNLSDRFNLRRELARERDK